MYSQPFLMYYYLQSLFKCGLMPCADALSFQDKRNEKHNGSWGLEILVANTQVFKAENWWVWDYVMSINFTFDITIL